MINSSLEYLSVAFLHFARGHETLKLLAVKTFFFVYCFHSSTRAKAVLQVFWCSVCPSKAETQPDLVQPEDWMRPVIFCFVGGAIFFVALVHRGQEL